MRAKKWIFITVFIFLVVQKLQAQTPSLNSLNSLNSLRMPNISANALFLYQNSSSHKEERDPVDFDPNPNGLNLQEAEIQIYSDVDPYSRLNLTLGLHPEWETDGSSVDEHWALELEEGLVESNVLTDITLKLGKFKAEFGKQNRVHSHAYVFVQAPLPNVALLGEEGLNDFGLSAAVLWPLPWFSETTFQYLRGKGENEAFNSPSPGKGIGLIHLKNFFDLNEETTLEVGISGVKGENYLKGETGILGLDLTLKWKPSEKGRSFVWVSELLARRLSQQGEGDDEEGSGFVSWIQYQFAERWSAQYRYDQVRFKNSQDETIWLNERVKRHSFGVTLNATEFSSFKLEYSVKSGGIDYRQRKEDEKTLFLQGSFTIGAHPTHSY